MWRVLLTQLLLDPKVWAAIIGLITILFSIWKHYLSHDAKLKRLKKEIQQKEEARDLRADKTLQDDAMRITQQIQKQDKIVKKWMQSDQKAINLEKMKDNQLIPFHIWLNITEIAEQAELDFDLVGAVCLVESNADPFAMRYEPNWKYSYNLIDFAKITGSTVETERIAQSTSWGIMQVMGTVAREYNHVGFLSQLCDIKKGLFYGCKHLKEKIKQFGLPDGIAAYNSGIPKKNEMGLFSNQGYVDKILENQAKLKALMNKQS